MGKQRHYWEGEKDQGEAGGEGWNRFNVHYIHSQTCPMVTQIINMHNEKLKITIIILFLYTVQW